MPQCCNATVPQCLNAAVLLCHNPTGALQLQFNQHKVPEIRIEPVDQVGDPLPEALAARLAGERPLAAVDALVVLESKAVRDVIVAFVTSLCRTQGLKLRYQINRLPDGGTYPLIPNEK